MKRFTGHTEPWGSFIDIKINAPEVLKKEAKRYREGTVMMGTVTDPYQPVERKYALSRSLLKGLADQSFTLHIQTKSALILRDLDILRDLSHAEIGMTIVTSDEKMRRIFEPKASPIKERFAALKRLSREGLDTFVFLGPILPHITRKSLAPLLNMIYSCGVRYIYIDKMNYIKSNLWHLSRAFKRIDPRLTALYLRLDDSYYDDLVLEIEEFCDKRGLVYQRCF